MTLPHSPTTLDPFAALKNTQRETWSGFAANEAFTTPPAAALVKFAGVSSGENVLDVGCGTGVVAITAARVCGKAGSVKGLDLTPALIERARANAGVAGAEIEFVVGDAEALPYADASFDVVLSQFGHMFAPRPGVVVAEMLRVLRPGGRIAFSTWPPEHGMGKFFTLVGQYMPKHPEGTPRPASPAQWGDPAVVRERLGEAVTDVRFDRAVAVSPTLSPNHSLAFMEVSSGLLTTLLRSLHEQPDQLARLRTEILAILNEVFADNTLRQHFLMTRAIKK